MLHTSSHTRRQADALAQGVPPGQLVLVLASAPHPLFRRQGASDLVVRVKLPLVNALAGGCVRLGTLDGRCVCGCVDDHQELCMRVQGRASAVRACTPCGPSDSCLLCVPHAVRPACRADTPNPTPSRVLSVPLDEVVTPGLVIKVPGEGLPLPCAAGGSALKVWLQRWGGTTRPGCLWMHPRVAPAGLHQHASTPHAFLFPAPSGRPAPGV